MLLALIWKFDFPPFMVLIIAILNDGKSLSLSHTHTPAHNHCTCSHLLFDNRNYEHIKIFNYVL